jgi:hypothetical protein
MIDAFDGLWTDMSMTVANPQAGVLLVRQIIFCRAFFSAAAPQENHRIADEIALLHYAFHSVVDYFVNFCGSMNQITMNRCRLNYRER